MLARFANRVEEGILSLLLVAMVLIVVFEITMRLMAPMLIEMGYLPNILWAEELTLMISAWMVLLGASYGVKVGSHIGVDAVVRLLPEGPRRAVSLIAVGLCLVYCSLFFWASWGLVEQGWNLGIELEELPIPEWLMESVLLIGFALLAVRFAQLGRAILKGEALGFHLADEAREALEELAKEIDPKVGEDFK